MGRAQTEVLGVVLLFGMVLVGATAIATVGVSGLELVQDEAETERDRLEMQTVAHEIASLGEGDRQAVGLEEPYDRVEGGRLVITVDGQEAYNESMGRLVTDDLVYEGGLVVQDGRAIGQPAVETHARSTQVTVPRLAGERFSGDLERTGTTAIRVDDPTANVTLTVHSEYAPAWYEALEGSGDARLVDAETVEVVFEGGNAPRPPTVSSAIAFGETGGVTVGEIDRLQVDSYVSSAGAYGGGNRGANATIRSPNALDFAAGGGGTVDLQIERAISSESINPGPWLEDDQVVEYADNVSVPVPTGDVIAAQESTQGAQLGTSDLTPLEAGGSYHTSDDLEVRDETLRLADDTSLFVAGNLTLENTTIVAEEDLRVYVTGNLDLGDDVRIETAGNPHRASAVQVFAVGDIQAGEERRGERAEPDTISLTGYIHASESTLYMHGELELYGALAIGDVQNTGSAQTGDLIVHYDEELVDTHVYVQDSAPSMDAAYTREAYYLRFVIPEIDTA
ncbi:DUF7289 family protein [Natronosalvus halobius]|uniref:DUF7289 family protein n=1 Tax=Natronosalvus halobius TaxID=2953746 RepID=UPI00209FCA71|nr:archaellin/type IV pilin N-terminal domain-containing protein [Natronosalvus halobius]USZ71495.1 hypothetical protein NGM15_15735 [Natronosalvus halobius]